MILNKLYSQIPIGKKNAITKEILCNKWAMSEREVRKTIQEMRINDFGDDYIIVSSSSGKGYYKTDSLEEIESFKNEILNRGKHTFLPLKKINRILKEKQTI